MSHASRCPRIGWLRSAVAVLLLGLQWHCGGGGARPDPAPVPAPGPVLTYGDERPTYTRGTEIPRNLPRLDKGKAWAFRATPDLPFGLYIDLASGALYGTPGVVSPATDYRITAVGEAEDLSCTLRITVRDAAPSNLTYPAAALTGTIGEPIGALAPRQDGGAVERYSVAPDLPRGLRLDPETGILAGVPLAESPSGTHVITASNPTGHAQFTLSVMVVPEPPPVSLGYRTNPAILSAGLPMEANLPCIGGGRAVRYLVDPPLPAGLALDPSSGVITGTPLVAMGPAVHRVTAFNSGGSATCSLELAIVQAASSLEVVLPGFVTSGKEGCVASVPDQGTGTVYLWSLDNATITGGQGTREITFRAGRPGALTARILAGTAWGRASSEAVAAPRPDLFAQDRVFRGRTGNLASVPVQPGTTCLWSIGGGTASAMGTGPLDGPVLTYATGPDLGTYTLSVSVTNQAGETSTTSRQLETVGGIFLKDVHAPQQRLHATATVLPGGRVLVPGGVLMDADEWTEWQPFYMRATASVELYDPATRTWAAAGALAESREMHAATLLANGKVLVTGGECFDPETGAWVHRVRAELYDPATDSWSDAGRMVGPHLMHTATLLQDGKVLVVGDRADDGSPMAEIYDPAGNTWSPVAPTGEPRRGHTATLLPDGKVLVAGGEADFVAGPRPGAERYDPLTGTWARAGDMAQGRYGHAATLLGNGQVLVTGGRGRTEGQTATAERYDPSTNAWSAVQGMASARLNHQATLLTDGRVLVSGGWSFSAPLGILNTAEVFDPSAGAWSSAGRLVNGRVFHEAVLLEDGDVLAFGGFYTVGGTSPGFIGSAERYSPSGNAWTADQDLGEIRVGATATLLENGKVLAAGGGNILGVVAAARIFDPASGIWSPAGTLASGRLLHRASGLGGGRALVTGGILGEETLAGAELYDSATNAWSTMAPMAQARREHTQTLLRNGKVLVAGGNAEYSSDWALSGAEVFDPSTLAWSHAASLRVARKLHTATLLQDGRVLVVGGSCGFGGDDFGRLASAEIYDPGTNSWSDAGNLAHARMNATATLLGDGKVLVAGGTGSGATESEVYDPATCVWSIGGMMVHTQEAPTATLLPGGEVLLVGGDFENEYLPFAELYDPLLNRWRNVRTANPKAVGHAAVLLGNGEVMLFGGSPGCLTEFWKP